jgi:hypothetical protein
VNLTSYDGLQYSSNNCATATCTESDAGTCCIPKDKCSTIKDDDDRSPCGDGKIFDENLNCQFNVCDAGSENQYCCKDSSCTVKTSNEWSALGCIPANVASTTVTGLGSVSPNSGYSSCDITCPTDGTFAITLVENSCIAFYENQWSALGCIPANVSATTVTGLGSVTSTAAICDITCPTDLGTFAITLENSCIAKETFEWSQAGCMPANVDATTVTGLGSVSPHLGYSSCVITCPTDGGTFAITLVSKCSTLAPSVCASGALISAAASTDCAGAVCTALECCDGEAFFFGRSDFTTLLPKFKKLFNAGGGC